MLSNSLLTLTSAPLGGIESMQTLECTGCVRRLVVAWWVTVRRRDNLRVHQQGTEWMWSHTWKAEQWDEGRTLLWAGAHMEGAHRWARELNNTCVAAPVCVKIPVCGTGMNLLDIWGEGDLASLPVLLSLSLFQTKVYLPMSPFFPLLLAGGFYSLSLLCMIISSLFFFLVLKKLWEITNIQESV